MEIEFAEHELENCAHVYIGLSGGVDSVVLLDLVFKYFNKKKWDLSKLTAIYINHQLQHQANDWAIFCKNLCQQYSIKFIQEKVDASPKLGESIEDFARTHRYQLFFKHVRPELDILLLAHHQDDQAETVLFRLLKGAGPKGLSGMAHLYRYQQRYIYRPLLFTAKQAIINYALENKLDNIQDPSNNLIDYDRNYLRQEILPALSSRFGSVNQAIARGATHYQNQQQALEYFIELELNKMQTEHVSGYICLDCKLFKIFPNPIQSALLRKWFELNQYKLPSEKKLSQILHQLNNAKADKIPEICWGNENQYILRKYQDKIFINKIADKNRANTVFYENIVSRKDIQKKTREFGQKIYISQKNHTVNLKNFLQELNVPPWDRNQVALYFYQEKYLVAVEGYWVDDKLMERLNSTPPTEKVHADLIPSPLMD